MPRTRNSLSVQAIILLVALTSYVKGQEEDPGNPLFLTPLIKSGETVQAREAAQVKDLTSIISYSGFITVNEEYNSNLFFWYFPAEEAPEDAETPVILFHDGGPGAACIGTLFNSGPFIGNEAGDNFTLNPNSMHKKFHMIYMDNPVDVGFSFIDKEEGIVYTPEEAARDITEFLVQFFVMFPNLQSHKFYASGESYGGTYAVEVATAIHQHNLDNPTEFINLEGIIADSPLFDYYSQTEYARVFYSAGLINRTTRDRYLETEKRLVELIAQEKYSDAADVFEVYIFDTLDTTGYGALHHISNDISSVSDMTPFITKNSTRKSIHVGMQTFHGLTNRIVVERMLANAFRRTVKPKLDALLKEGYKCLIFVGNMDIITGHVGIQTVLGSLTWEHAQEMLDGPREIWTDDEGVAGYVTRAGNTSAFAVLRNAGHVVLMGRAERAVKLIGQFVGNSTWLHK